MQKSLFIFSLLSVILLADTSLGTPIGNSALLLKNHVINKPIEKKKIEKIEKIRKIEKAPAFQPNNALTTRITPKKIKSNFREDNHRYDKRYSNFDYEDNGYNNDDGYYYGYYNNRGYFYDNVFYGYDNQYTYYNRRHRLGYFGRSYHHHRPYVYHSYNNWNQVHCYREPNVIVYGHYYDRSYYPQQATNYYYPAYNNRYNNYSPAARMTTRHNTYTAPRHYNNSYNSSHYYNNYNSSRMSTSHSYTGSSYSNHGSVSRMQIAR